MPLARASLIPLRSFLIAEVAFGARSALANASNFPEAFRGLLAGSGDTLNRDYSSAYGWNTPKCEYRGTRQSGRETIEKIYWYLRHRCASRQHLPATASPRAGKSVRGTARARPTN
jgi:hypothetical protein